MDDKTKTMKRENKNVMIGVGVGLLAATSSMLIFSDWDDKQVKTYGIALAIVGALAIGATFVIPEPK